MKDRYINDEPACVHEGPKELPIKDLVIEANKTMLEAQMMLVEMLDIVAGRRQETMPKNEAMNLREECIMTVDNAIALVNKLQELRRIIIG